MVAEWYKNGKKVSGIQYGTIHKNNFQFWVHGLDWVRNRPVYCRYCGWKFPINYDLEEELCPFCDEFMEGRDWCILNEGKIIAMMDEKGMVWFFKSPYKAKADFQNITDLCVVHLTARQGDIVGYAPPPDWLLDGIKLNYVKS